MSVSFYQKHFDVETWWDNHKNDWLNALKKSPLYEELRAKYDPKYLDKNLDYLADRRTNAWRYGPPKLLNRQRMRFRYLPKVFELIGQVQAKKVFNFGMRWRAEKIKVPGLWHTFQLSKIEDNKWSVDFIPPFSNEDLDFVKHLLQDEAFINTRENWKFFWTISSKEMFDFDGNPLPLEKVEEIYPLLYQRYDEWFGTGDLLRLCDIRKKKEQELDEALWRSQGKEKTSVSDYVEPAGEPFWRQVGTFTNAYFRKEEPTEIVRLLDAHDLFFPDGNSMEEIEYEAAFYALIAEKEPGYPNGAVNWKDATIFLGRKILFSKIRDVMDEGFAEYQYNLANKIPMSKNHEEKDPLDLHPQWLEEFVAARQFLGLSTNPDDL